MYNTELGGGEGVKRKVSGMELYFLNIKVLKV